MNTEENTPNRYFEIIIGGRHGFTAYFKTTKTLPTRQYDSQVITFAMVCGELDRAEIMDLVSVFEISKDDIPDGCRFVGI